MGLFDFFTKPRPPAAPPSTLPVAGPNDKLIIVDNVAQAQLLSVLADFCRLHNATEMQVQLKLISLPAGRLALVSPQNLSFENLCFLVNYLHYPIDVEWAARIFAWDTLRADNPWFGATQAGTRVILFIPPDDTEHDNVFVTTEHNAGFQLSFGLPTTARPLPAPKELFAPAPLSVASLLAAEGQVIQ